MSRPFIDYVKVTARGGDGGDGCTAFDRQPYQPRGGPNGGDGGPGGDVIMIASSSKSTLTELNFKPELKGPDGQRGKPNNQRGATGQDLEIQVPPGTIIRNAETGEFIGELTEDGEKIVVAQGGKGGRGNRCFTNSRRQRPRFHEFGEPGEEIALELELKLLADAGFVGFPNAGKSTLLNALTAAHPRIADHPFTTISPNLGVLFQDHERMVLCDIPGIIEDAHLGAGLGIEFLRHIERTKILIYVIDINGKDPVGEFDTIRNELESYRPEMLDKPGLIVCNKIDLEDPELIELFKEEIDFPEEHIVAVSALEETGIDKLVEKLWEIFENLKEQEAQKQNLDAEETERLIKLEQRQPIRVEQLQDRFLLSGDEVVRLIERFDLSNTEALSYVRERLLDMGLHKKLERAGCKPGDTVQVGQQEFEYTG